LALLCLSNHCMNIKKLFLEAYFTSHTSSFSHWHCCGLCHPWELHSSFCCIFPYSSYTSQILLLFWPSTHHTFLWQLNLLYITHPRWPSTFFSQVPQYVVFILVFSQWVCILLCFPLTVPAVLQSTLFQLFNRSLLGMYQNATGASWIAQQLLAMSFKISCITCKQISHQSSITFLLVL